MMDEELKSRVKFNTRIKNINGRNTVLITATFPEIHINAETNDLTKIEAVKEECYAHLETLFRSMGCTPRMLEDLYMRGYSDGESGADPKPPILTNSFGE